MMSGQCARPKKNPESKLSVAAGDLCHHLHFRVGAHLPGGCGRCMVVQHVQHLLASIDDASQGAL